RGGGETAAAAPVAAADGGGAAEVHAEAPAEPRARLDERRMTLTVEDASEARLVHPPVVPENAARLPPGPLQQVVVHLVGPRHEAPPHVDPGGAVDLLAGPPPP